MTKLTKTALRRKKPVTDEVLIPADDDQRKRLEDAQQAVKNAEQGLALVQIAGESDEEPARQRVADARAAVEAVREEIRKTGVSIMLVSAGQEKYDEVQLACPPTEEQKKEAEEKSQEEPLYDPRTFWPALVAASVPDSDLTADDWRLIVFESKEWGPAELEELRNRTLSLYMSSRIAQLGN